jgi:hypothetical protein
MSALDIKLFRDVRRLWAQVLAIALIIGGGVATLVLAVGSHRSLDETRIAYYERYAFADVFAVVKRAPKALASQIAQIPGVAAVDTRIARLALLDIPGFAEPATGQFVSLPDFGEPLLNRLYIRAGRLPEPERAEEVVVNESFAQAHTQLARLPGVLATEPFREVPVRIRHGNIERRIMISGRPPDADLRPIIDVNLRPVVLPSTGLAISGWLGKILSVQAGDWVGPAGRRASPRPRVILRWMAQTISLMEPAQAQIRSKAFGVSMNNEALAGTNLAFSTPRIALVWMLDVPEAGADWMFSIDERICWNSQTAVSATVGRIHGRTQGASHDRPACGGLGSRDDPNALSLQRHFCGRNAPYPLNDQGNPLKSQQMRPPSDGSEFRALSRPADPLSTLWSRIDLR